MGLPVEIELQHIHPGFTEGAESSAPIEESGSHMTPRWRSLEVRGFEPSVPRQKDNALVSSLHAGARDTTHGANDRICHQGERQIAEEGGIP